MNASLYGDTMSGRVTALQEQAKVLAEVAQKELELAEASEDNKEVIQSEIDALKLKNDELDKSINGYSRTIGEIQGVTSAYKKWLQAQNAPNDADMYDGMGDAQDVKRGL